MINILELKSAALAATQGVWVARADGWTIRAYPDNRLAADGIKVVHTCSAHMQGQGSDASIEQQIANQHYIEMAQPAAVLELVAEVERLQADNQSLRGSCAAMGKDRMFYVRGQSKALKERDQLKAENETLRKALHASAVAMWNSEADMDAEAQQIDAVLASVSKEASHG